MNGLEGKTAVVTGAGSGIGLASALAPISELDAAAILKVLAVNLVAPMLTIKHAAPAIAKQGGGSIICTASVAALGANAAAAHYSASKAGVVSLVKSAASELAASGIRVNAICPGLIETGMTQFLFDAARRHGTTDKIGQLNPLNRHGEAGEVAALVAFLSSSDASYINGQAIVVDGGLSCSLPHTPGNTLSMELQQSIPGRFT